MRLPCVTVLMTETTLSTSSPDATSGPALTVYYDGACPLCSREIAFYRRRNGAERVDWCDVSKTEPEALPPGLTRERALARFHVQAADGSLSSGGQAFARLWRVLPDFSVLGRMFQLPGLAWCLERAYRLFLPLRPVLARRWRKAARPVPSTGP